MKKLLTVMALLGMSSISSIAQVVIDVEDQSLQSLYVEGWRDNVPINSGTGFLIKSKTRYYLITNWHIVNNIDLLTNDWAIKDKPFKPNRILIRYRGASLTLDTVILAFEDLYDKRGTKLFKEFKSRDVLVDCVAVPLKEMDTSKVSLLSIDYHNTYNELSVPPGQLLSVVGYPLGHSNTYFLPVWKTGALASEIRIDEQGKPLALVDMQGYDGMSGSPVYYFTSNAQAGNTSGIGGGRQAIFLGMLAFGSAELHLEAFLKNSYLEKEFDKLE
jgi:hypothetical protein